MTDYPDKKPFVSVIIPIYNTEQFLRECLESVIKQTLQNIEIICIDDGSTDNSPIILREYADKDKRIIIHSQENKGGGAARNTGLKMAKGKYLAFLDSDDYLDIQTLEKSYQKAIEENSDIVTFKGKIYNNVTCQYDDMPWIFESKYFPLNNPFSWNDIPDYIFQVFGSVVWNKIYKKELIDQYNIHFKEFRRSNDSFFTYISLIRAKYISALDEVLVFYRTGYEDSCQATYHESPLDFYNSLVAIKIELQKDATFSNVERSYINRILTASIFYLTVLKKNDVYDYLYNFIKNKILKEIGFSSRSKEYFFPSLEFHYYEAKKIETLSAVEYLFEQRNTARVELDYLQNERNYLLSEKDTLQKEYNAILASFSFRLGRILTWFPRKVRGFFRCLKENGFIYTIKHFVQKCLRKIKVIQ